MLVRALALILTIFAGATAAQASNTFSNLPAAVLPLSAQPTAVPMDQGAGCPYNTQPCTTVQAPASAFFTAAGAVFGTPPTVVGDCAVWINTMATGPLGDSGPCPPISLAINAASGAPTVLVNSPLNGAYISSGGAKTAVCPGFGFGCSPSSGGTLSQFAQYGAVMTTSADARTSENGLLIDVVNVTGQAQTWLASTSYSTGQEAFNVGNVYQQTVLTCTSAISTGPTGTGTAIPDNTCLWNFIGPMYGSAKQGLNINILSMAGGGQSWAATLLNDIQSGWNSNFATALEIEAPCDGCTVDPFVGSGTTIDDIYIGGRIGSHPRTSQIYMSISPNGSLPSNYGAYNGIWQNGANSIKNYNIWDSTTGAFIGWYISGSHVQSTMQDASTAPSSRDLTGNFSTAVDYYNCASCGENIFFHGSGAPAGFGSDATFTFGVFNDNSTATEFLNAGGDYSTSHIVFSGTSPNYLLATSGTFSVTSAGLIHGTAYQVGASAGVTCPTGSPTSSFATSGGIVIHC